MKISKLLILSLVISFNIFASEENKNDQPLSKMDIYLLWDDWIQHPEFVGIDGLTNSQRNHKNEFPYLPKKDQDRHLLAHFKYIFAQKYKDSDIDPKLHEDLAYKNAKLFIENDRNKAISKYLQVYRKRSNL